MAGAFELFQRPDEPQTAGTAFDPVTRQQQLQNYRNLEGAEGAWRSADGSPWKASEPGAFTKAIGRALESEPGQRLMTLSMFLGPGAKTANTAALTKAQGMASSGAPREKIWSDTGWFQGPDKKWRFELSDHNAKVTDYRYSPNEAFKETAQRAFIDQHPFMIERRDAMKPYQNLSTGDVVGQWRAQGSKIVDAAKSGDTDLAMSLIDKRRGLDFMLDAMGDRKYGPAHTYLKHPWLYRSYPDIAMLHTKIDPALEYLGAYYPKNNWRGDYIALREMSPFSKDNKSTMLHELQHKVQRDEGFATGGTGRNPEEYKRIAGEAEARLVQNRMDMTPEQRAARPPWLDYDVPEAQMIIK